MALRLQVAALMVISIYSMTKQVHFKIGGTWTEIKNVWIKENGVWTEKAVPHVNDGGTWKPCMQYLKTVGLSFDGTNDHIDVGSGGDIERIFVEIETSEAISGDYNGTHWGPLMARSGSFYPVIWIGALSSSISNETISLWDGTYITYTTGTIPAGRNEIEIEWDGSKYVVSINGVAQTMNNDGSHASRNDVDGMDEMCVRSKGSNYLNIKLYRVELDYPSQGNVIYPIDEESGTVLNNSVYSGADGTINGATWIGV